MDRGIETGGPTSHTETNGRIKNRKKNGQDEYEKKHERCIQHGPPQLPWGQRSMTVTISTTTRLHSPQIMKIKRKSNQFRGAF